MPRMFAILCLFLPSIFHSAVGAEDDAPKLSLIIMDPLSAPLSCPCVEGYAQRRYEVLAEHLTKTMNRSVRVVFADSLQGALKKSDGAAHVIIGKHSVVSADAAERRLKVRPLAHLTDLKGSTTQHGLIVVNRKDPAMSVKDLGGYTIIFGPSEADEKHAAAMKLLTDAGISVPKKVTIDAACSDGACRVIDLGPESKTAAVISSYAQPLLEGCGTIKKGDLRVVGTTKSVPFITAFATSQLSRDEQQKVKAALTDLTTRTEILKALESLVGFLPATEPTSLTAASKKN